MFRITPAPAGNTIQAWSNTVVAGDHPRTCGEHRFRIEFHIRIRGSPPHLRGTPISSLFILMLSRITPAPAGNTSMDFCLVGHEQDHPRTCGEHGDAGEKLLYVAGSPPHLRGTPIITRVYDNECGITPAPAGNTVIGGVRDGNH